MQGRRKLGVIALVYVIEGTPMGVFVDVLNTWFARIGLSNTDIGLLSGFSLAWTLKFLWSPLIDRFGTHRRWIAGANLALGAALLALAASGGEQAPPLALLVLATSLYCAASATQDIAIDAYTIGLVEAGEEGPANAMRNTGYRAGMLLAAALFFLPRWIGWNGTLAAAGLLHFALAAALRWTPHAEVAVSQRRALGPLLRAWFGREGAIGVFAFVLLYRLGDLAMGPMVKPFWVARGFSNEAIGLVSVTLGIAATIAGAWCAAGLLLRLHLARGLLWIGAIALASNLGYALAASMPQWGDRAVYAASLCESFCSGMAGVAFMSYLMRICDKAQAAVQYALLTATYAAAGSLAKMGSGALVDSVGFAAFFALTALLALPGLFCLPAARRWLDVEPASAA